MADGHTSPTSFAGAAELLNDNRPALRKVAAFAHRSQSYDRFTGAARPYTKVTEDREGRRFVCGLPRFAEDGELLPISHNGRAYRLTVVEPDCDVIVRQSTDLVDKPICATLAAFLADNEFDVAERVAIQTIVTAGGLYIGGGGAAADWFVHRADVGPEIFVRADGSPFFARAA